MFVIGILLLAGGEPVASPLRSREGYASAAICEAALVAEIPRLTELAARLTAQTGLVISYRAACVDLTPGEPA